MNSEDQKVSPKFCESIQAFYKQCIHSRLLISRIFSNPPPLLLNLENLKSTLRESVHCSAQKNRNSIQKYKEQFRKRIAYEWLCLFQISTSTICVFCFLSHSLFHPPFIPTPCLLVFQNFHPPIIPTPRLFGTLEYMRFIYNTIL